MSGDVAAEIERLKEKLRPLRRAIARIPSEKTAEKQQILARIDVAQGKLNQLHVSNLDAEVRAEIARLRGNCSERTDFVARFGKWCAICQGAASNVLHLATNAKKPETMTVSDATSIIGIAFPASDFKKVGYALNGVSIAMTGHKFMSATMGKTPGAAAPIVTIATDMMTMFEEMATETDVYYERFLEEKIPNIVSMEDIGEVWEACKNYEKGLPKPQNIKRAILQNAVESATDEWMRDDILAGKIGDSGYLNIHIRVTGMVNSLKADTVHMYIDDIGPDLTFAVMQLWSGKSIFDLPVSIGGQIDFEFRTANARAFGSCMFARKSRTPGNRSVQLISAGPGVPDMAMELAEKELYALKVDQIQYE